MKRLRWQSVIKITILILFMLIPFVLTTGNHDDTRELRSIQKQVQAKGGLTQSPAKKDTLHWIGNWKGEGQRQAFIENIVHEYGFLNQNIFVDMIYREDIEAYQQIHASQRDERDGLFIAHMIQNQQYDWDIIPMLSNMMYQVIGQELNNMNWGHEHLVNFYDLPDFKEHHNPVIYDNRAFTADYSDILTAPIIEGAYYLMYYNQDLAEEIGLDIPQTGMTWQQFTEYIKDIHNYNLNNNTHIAAIYDASDWTTVTYIFAHLFKSLLNYYPGYQYPDDFTEELQHALIHTLEAFESLAPYSPLIESAGTNIWFDTRDLVLNDRAVFYINGTWMYNLWEVIDRQKANKMIPTEMPVFKPMNYYQGEYKCDFAVLKNSPNKDLAIDLMRFIAQEDIADDWVRFAKSPTGLRRSFQSGGSGGDIHETFISQISAKYGKNIDNNQVYYFGKKHNISILNHDLHRLLWGQITAQNLYVQLISQL